MDGFSDIESSSSDVGAEVNEVETPDADFGDGDGVNDFDDTYESMNSGDETLVYSQETPESVENNSEDIDTVVDEQLNDFDDVGETDESVETPDATPAGDNIEQTPSDMTTDENIDNTLSDFDDESDTETTTEETGDAETESTADETEEVDTESPTDETDEANAESASDETGEADTESATDETREAETESANDETGEADAESPADETGETDTESASDDIEEADTESAPDETEEVDTESPTDETDEANAESASDETGEADTESATDETREADTESANDETGEADAESASDETGKTETESTTDEASEADAGSPADETGETDTESASDETDEAGAESTVAENGETDTESIADETGEADTETTADGNNETSNDDVIEGAEEASEMTSESQNGDTEALNIDGSNDGGNDGTDSNTDAERDHTEKNAVFENVSYHQGQNDLGALGTCGPTSIANSLNRVTGSTEYTENKVLHNAMDNNLCHKSDNPYSCGGTTTRDVVSIIDNVKNPDDNIHTEVYEYDKALSVDDLAKRLDDPGMVAMVGVDSATLWDQRGDVACSGLFQHTDSPSDHWITVDSPIRDETGNLAGFNIVDSGGGVSEVSRDKFEAMYMGDTGHTVSDPTAILISNSVEGGNTFATSEGIERTSNYKGSAEVSDGNDPPREIATVTLANTEKTTSGLELSPEQAEVNQYFRGDQFSKENTFENSIDKSAKKDLIDANNATTCGFNENLNGSFQDNTKYSSAVSPEKVSELNELRSNVSEVTEDTVMQKVIAPEQFADYTKESVPRTDVSGCASKASDVAPYTNNIEQAYETLRLDYEGTVYKDLAENNGDMYVMRFTSEYCPTNTDYLKMDGSEPWNKPPCTGTGFTGSGEHMVPEYTYGRGQEITDGAIYKVDSEGNETMVAYWNHGHFEKID